MKNKKGYENYILGLILALALLLVILIYLGIRFRKQIFAAISPFG